MVEGSGRERWYVSGGGEWERALICKWWRGVGVCYPSMCTPVLITHSNYDFHHYQLKSFPVCNAQFYLQTKRWLCTSRSRRLTRAMLPSMCQQSWRQISMRRKIWMDFLQVEVRNRRIDLGRSVWLQFSGWMSYWRVLCWTLGIVDLIVWTKLQCDEELSTLVAVYWLFSCSCVYVSYVMTWNKWLSLCSYFPESLYSDYTF